MAGVKEMHLSLDAGIRTEIKSSKQRGYKSHSEYVSELVRNDREKREAHRYIREQIALSIASGISEESPQETIAKIRSTIANGTLEEEYKKQLS